MKKMSILAVFFVLSVFLLAPCLIQVQGTPDGTVAGTSYQGGLYFKGSVKKDISNPSSIFDGTYGSALSYELADHELLSNQIYTYGSSAWGNITLNPAEIVHDDYNSSGYLDISDWTETDSGSILSLSSVNTADQSGAPNSMRTTVTSTLRTNNSATLELILGSSVTPTNYFSFGAYIGQESTNATNTLYVKLFDSDGEYLLLNFQEASTNWDIAGATGYESIYFDEDPGDVIFFQKKISDWDALRSNVTIGSIVKIQLLFTASTNWAGTCVYDIFACDFTEDTVKLGKTRSDQTADTTTWSLANVTDPSSPDLKLREFHTSVDSAINADIDFVVPVDYASTPDFEESTGRITEEWDAKIDLSSDWESEVTYSSVNLYYVLAGYHSSEAPAGSIAYYSYQVGGSESLSSILGEEPSDCLTVASSVSVSSSMTATNVIIERDATDEEGTTYGGLTYRLNIQTDPIFGISYSNWFLVASVALLILFVSLWTGVFPGKADNNFNRRVHRVGKFKFKGKTLTTVVAFVSFIIMCLAGYIWLQGYMWGI